jgi:hypothetical protein
MHVRTPRAQGRKEQLGLPGLTILRLKRIYVRTPVYLHYEGFRPSEAYLPPNDKWDRQGLLSAQIGVLFATSMPKSSWATSLAAMSRLTLPVAAHPNV